MLKNTSLFVSQLDTHSFKGAGNFSGARTWYDTFPDLIRARIRDTGFEAFVLALPSEKGRSDYQPLHALMERWSESTHTFQLPFGEYTLDPVSFAAITSIACAGEPVPLDASLHPLTGDREDYVRTLLGVVPDMKGIHTMKIDSLRAYYRFIISKRSPCSFCFTLFFFFSLSLNSIFFLITLKAKMS